VSGAQPYVYKICSRAAWREARQTGRLAFSADDHRDGFTHLSAREQVRGTLEKHFTGQTDLLLLAVPASALATADLRWEVARDGQHFPHLYAELHVHQVEDVFELPLERGEHRLPAGF